MNNTRLLSVLVPLLVLLIVQPVRSQTQADKFSLGFDGIPLKYQRVYDYEYPYPEVDGLLVQSAEDGARAIQAGLRLGNIITAVNDTPVETAREIRSIVTENFGQEVTFKLYRKSSRYDYRLRHDPFYEPGKSDPYVKDTVTTSYDTPGIQRDPVIAGPTGDLYHKKKFAHSPDTATNTIYLNPSRAKFDGLNPCPICFPSAKGESLESMIEGELTGSSKNVKSLTKGAPRIENIPEDLVAIKNRLEPHLIRPELELSLQLFQSDRMYAFGLPGGEIILTYNLYQYAETREERAAMLAQLLAHADRSHNHQPVEENRIRSLVERAIRRTTGVDFEFSQLKELSPRLPGFAYYQELLEQGYGDSQSRESVFYAMLYLYRAGYDLDGINKWMTRKRDMQNNVHPLWLDYTLAHPIPIYLNHDIRRWKELIPQHFERKQTSPDTAN